MSLAYKEWTEKQVRKLKHREKDWKQSEKNYIDNGKEKEDFLEEAGAF